MSTLASNRLRADIARKHLALSFLTAAVIVFVAGIVLGAMS